MNWNAVGAIAAIASVFVALYFGLRYDTAQVQSTHQVPPGQTPPSLPPIRPEPPPIEPAPQCLALKIPACPDNINSVASDVINSCQKYIALDSKNPLAYSLVGRGYRALGRLGEAETAFQTQLTLAQSLNDGGMTGQAYYNLATIQLRNGTLDRAEFYIQKSLEQAKNNNIALAANYKILGDIYYKRNQFAQAENYFQRSIEFFQQIDDKLGLGAAYTGLAFSQFRQGNRGGCQFLQRAKAVIANVSCNPPKNDNEKYLNEARCY